MNKMEYNKTKKKLGFYPSTEKCQIVTPSHSIFTEIRNAVYENDNKHRLPLDLFGELDEFGLLIWYLDDGGKYGRAQSITSKLSERKVKPYS